MPSTNFDRALGQFLAELRERSGLSQEALGAAVRRDQSVVSKIESGARRVAVADLLAWLQALGIELADIVTDLQSVDPGPQATSLWDAGDA